MKPQKEGIDAVRAALSHAPVSIVAGEFYTIDSKPITARAGEDLYPEDVMGSRRKAWA